MWYCPSCGNQNSAEASFCTECGQRRPDQTPQAAAPASSGTSGPTPAPAPSLSQPKKSSWWLWALLVLALVAGIAVIGYFTVHIWQPASCTEPSVCRICGKTQGEALGHEGSAATCEEASVCVRCGTELAPALGHDWQAATCTEPGTCSRCGAVQGEALGHDARPATCTEPSVCRRCGETVSPALGHDWQSATYDRPETCSRCGTTRGDVKGWVGDLYGSMGSETLYLYGDSTSHPYILDTPVSRCMRLTLYLNLKEYTGNPFGTWALFGRDSNGSWSRLTTFPVDKLVVDDFVAFPLTLDGRPSFEALSLVPLTSAEYTISYSFYYEDVQVYVD